MTRDTADSHEADASAGWRAEYYYQHVPADLQELES